MEAIEELVQLSESMLQASSILADEEDIDSSSSKRLSITFLNVVALGNVGAGKSAVLNSLIGHPVLPTGENGATRAPISIDLQRDSSLSNKAIVLQIDSKSQQVSASALRHSLQDRLSKSVPGKGRADEIYLKLRTSTAPPLKLIDLPGLDQRAVDDSMIREYVERNDAVLLVVVPAAQAPEISSSRTLKLIKDMMLIAPEPLVSLVRELTEQFPATTPLALVLKQFLADRSLDHSYSGGLSSYCLVLLVTRFLQHEHHLGRPINQNLGSLLRDFLYFFGNAFDPRQMCISIQGTGVYVNRERGQCIDPVHIDDPLFPANNVGRNCFRIHQCIKKCWTRDSWSS